MPGCCLAVGVGDAAGAPGLGKVLAVFLAGWLLESIHYALLLARYGVGAPVSAAEMAARVFLGGLLSAFTRLLMFAGALWVSSWLVSARLGGKECLEASAYATLAMGLVALLLTPLAGLDGFRLYVSVLYAAQLAAAGWAMLVSARGRLPRAPRGRLVAAAALAAVLAGLTPASLLYPQAYVYSLIASSTG